jgi:hypothetical protein
MTLPNFDELSTRHGLLAFAIGYLLYCAGVVIHRLYFSKYAAFPGPKLAAITYWYMFYYDVIAGSGQYIYKIKELHDEYSQCNIVYLVTLNLPELRQSYHSDQSSRTSCARPGFLRCTVCRGSSKA